MDKAYKSSDCEAIRTQIKSIQDNGLDKKLAADIRQAQTVLELLLGSKLRYRNNQIVPDPGFLTFIIMTINVSARVSIEAC